MLKKLLSVQLIEEFTAQTGIGGYGSPHSIDQGTDQSQEGTNNLLCIHPHIPVTG